MTNQDMPTGTNICMCGESFPSEPALEEHAREAHGEMTADDVESLTCPVCQSVVGTFDQFREHQKHHATPERARDES